MVVLVGVVVVMTGVAEVTVTVAVEVLVGASEEWTLYATLCCLYARGARVYSRCRIASF